MDYPEYRWVDIALNGVQHRNRVVDIGSWRPPETARDAYRTVYRYPDAFRDHWQQTRTVSGYQGPSYADYLPIDIDAADLADALAVARSACDRLAVRFEMRAEQLRIFFSGQKGFHLLLPAACVGAEPRADLHRVFAALAEAWCGGLAYDGSIYDNVRLFRLSNTRHGKSGLFKIPLSAWELMHWTPEQIREAAHTKRQLEWEEPELHPAWAEAYQGLQLDPPLASNAQASGATTHAPPCIDAMLQGVGAGDRHGVALRLAAYFAHRGLPVDSIAPVLDRWNAKNTPPMDARRAQAEFAKLAGEATQYDFGCKDTLRQRFCGGACPYRKPKTAPPATTEAGELVDFDAAAALEAYGAYVQARKNGGIRLGIPILDKKLRGLAPGEVVQVLARAGVGKTAFLLNLLRSVVFEQQVPAAFFTLEMPVAQIVERAIQISTNLPGDQVEAAALAFFTQQTDNPIFSRYLAEWGYCRFVERDGLTLPLLDRYLQHYQASEAPVQLVAIDYLGRMEDTGKDYEKISRLARGLKTIAKTHRVAIVCLHQTSREGGDGTVPVTMDMGRDSGQIEEGADVLMGMWRPAMKEAEDEEYEPVELAVLKSRKSPTGHLRIWFRKASLRIGSPQYVTQGLDDIAQQKARQQLGSLVGKAAGS